MRYIFEGVPETDEAKRDGVRADRPRLPTPTRSSPRRPRAFLSTQLAGFSGRPERFLNTHWLNPAFLVPVVELSPTPATDRAVIDEFKALLTSIGKVPVECAASPGYIVPRIQALAMNEAARLVEEGVASAEDIDKAVKYGFGFRFAALGAARIHRLGRRRHSVLCEPLHGRGDERQALRGAADRARQHGAGRNGLRDGKGFYDYSGMDVGAYRRERLAAFLRALQGGGVGEAAGATNPLSCPPR